ncbi:S4 domain-containing protein YaaA [Caryophanon tenue]|uniref:S4 domain-containing protein YaaA n=1 Tax=Caryophanon tenue TaxID=33978 RepID=UPI001B7FF4D1
MFEIWRKKYVEELIIDTEYITLGQALKLTDTISSGGMAKWFLSEHTVFVNGEEEDRRGRKLRDGDLLNIPGTGRFKIVEQQGE